MQQFDLLLRQFLEGRSIYGPVRRVLNFVFTVSLTSYLYTRVYGPYRIYELSERDAIIGFFTSGTFIIPFSLFVIVYFLTQWVAALFFLGCSNLALVIGAKYLREKRWKQREIRSLMRDFERTKHYWPEQPSQIDMGRLVVLLRDQLNPQLLSELKEELKEPVKKAEASFILFARTALAVTVYFNALPQFGWRLYALIFTVLAVAMLILIAGVVILQVIPHLVARVRTELVKYSEQRAALRKRKQGLRSAAYGEQPQVSQESQLESDSA